MLENIRDRILEKTAENNIRRCIIFFFASVILSFILYFWVLMEHKNQQVLSFPWSFHYFTVFYFLLAALIGYRFFHTNVHKIKSWLGNAIYIFAIPFFLVYIEEFMWNPEFTNISRANYFYINYTIVLLIEIGLLLITNRPLAAYVSLSVIFWLYGVINYYVLQFKGHPPLPNDLYAIRTASNVMGLYTYHLSDSLVLGTLGLLCLLVTLSYFPPVSMIRNTVKSCAVLACSGILWLYLSLNWFYQIDMKETFNIGFNFWEPQYSFYEYGAPLSFFYCMQSMIQEEPEGYSNGAAREILAEYDADASPDVYTDEPPSVIVIMNEAFSDLSVLGDFESDDYLSNYHQLTSYVMKGYAYSSIYGGGTCNSEFEFLTGNSMSNFNGSLYPYQMYDREMEHTFNLSKAFSEHGYETIAFHPYNADGWNRKSVYEKFGFEDFLSLEELEDVQYLRWCPSDEYDFNQVIELYENRTRPLFLFNVTMQNHGGYNINSITDMKLVSIEETYNQYTDVITYLTCMRESDIAFAELIEYFSKQEEPVIICMFGDHQPSLDSEFIEAVRGTNDGLADAEKLYMVPYVIWCNYNLGAKEINLDMSINYLGANVLNMAGIQTPYTDFLLDLQQKVPVINVVGYQTSDGVWHDPEEENDMISTYRILQHYQMFGK